MISLRRFTLYATVHDRPVATSVVTYVHPNHSYGRFRGGVAEAYESARGNLVLAGGPDPVFTIDEANWVRTEDTLAPSVGSLSRLPSCAS